MLRKLQSDQDSSGLDMALKTVFKEGLPYWIVIVMCVLVALILQRITRAGIRRGSRHVKMSSLLSKQNTIRLRGT